MTRVALLILPVLLVSLARPAQGAPATQAIDAQALYERVTPSLVAVQFIWENELGRQELTGAGIVVGEGGLVMTSLSMFDLPLRSGPLRLPDKQLKEFKILVPSQDHEADEIDAVFEGRDERTNTAFVRPKSPQKWPVLKFEERKTAVGEPVYSVGLLHKNAAYKSYYTQGVVSANLRGELPQVLVIAGALAGMGSPVFNSAGEAIGIVNSQPEQTPFLNDPRNALQALSQPPMFFVPTSDFVQGISDPPTAGAPLALPWMGIPQQAMSGVNKDVAESMGLGTEPAVEVGDVIAGSPAEKAGLKPGNIVVKINGEPLDRADEPAELPGIVSRKVRKMKVGDTVTLSVLEAKGQPLKEIKIKLEERPKGPNLAERWYAEDTGFSVREIVFMDTYVRKLPSESKGVVVSLIKPNSSAAAAKLGMNDLVSEMNGQPVTDLEQFKKAYEAVRKEKPRDAIVLVVLRDGNTQTIRLEPPQ
ncbi:MAG: PDZ domain-containing protein [Tepidisphaeraceae bacterium]